MSQEFQVTWVGDNTKTWQGTHGSFIDYFLKLAGYDHTVKLTQKPETAPPAPGDTIYGGIIVETVKGKDGPFESHKLKKEQRPDGQPQGERRAQPHKVRQPALEPTPEFWAQKDKRIARAGVVQAVIAGRYYDPAALGVPLFVKQVNEVADAVLASLDQTTPHPNEASSQSNGKAKGGAEEKAVPPKVAPEEAEKIIARTKELPADRWLLELVSCGAGDISDPPAAIRNLTPAQASQFQAKLDDLAKEKVPAGDISDDDDIPF